MKTWRIFVSSPGDVAEERALAQRVLQRLQGELAGRVVLEPVFWEHEPLLATATFQDQIVQPSATDVVICILWSRLGTRLPAQFTRADGSRYASGTEFEFEDAVAGFRSHGRPRLLVYRRTSEALVRLDDRVALLERLQQKESLDAFVQKWFHDAAEGTLRAAFHAYSSPGQFEELVETHLRKLVNRELAAWEASREEPAQAPAPPVPATLAWPGGSPYRGLQAFEHEHAAVYFGRSKAVGVVLDALRRQALGGKAFALVVGASGSGKSSLVRAGVVPLLTQPGVVEGIGLWRWAVMRPADFPTGSAFLALAVALMRPGGLPELAAGGLTVPQLATMLRDDPTAVVPLVRRALSWSAMDLTMRSQLTRTPRARFALVVDQLEELFLLERLAGERAGFAAALAALAGSVDVWVVATLRSDCYRLLAGEAGFVALKEGAGQVDLLPPTAGEIGQMIRQPALAAGLRFEEDATSGERLEEVLREAAMASANALPLLEFTLEELYQRRSSDGVLTFAAYRELGGLEGALAQRAEQTLASQPPTVQAAFGLVLRGLIALAPEAGAIAVERRAPRAEIAVTAAAGQLIDAFVAARLFVADDTGDGEAVIALAHPALLRCWPRLASWLEADRETLRARARLNLAAARWQEEGRSSDFLLAAGKPLAEASELAARPDVVLSSAERDLVTASRAGGERTRRMRRLAQAGLVVLAVLAIGAALLADSQRRRARTEAKRAAEVSAFLARLFEVADPARSRGGEINVRALLDDGVSRVRADLAGQPLAQARVMTTIGDVYRRLGDLRAAAPLLGEALSIRQLELPEAHPDLAESLDRLGRLREDEGNYVESEALLRRAVEIRRRALGARSPAVAESLTALGHLLRVQLQRFAEAEGVLREALEIRQQAFGVESAQVAETTAELAGALGGKGDVEPAKGLLGEVIERQRRIAGADSLEVASAMRDLAELLSQWANDAAGAEPLYRQALAIERQILGENHPIVAWELNNLALAVAELGRTQEAERLLRQAVTVLRASRGERHPEVASLLDNLAIRLQRDGRMVEAERELRQALVIRREAFGDDDYQTSWSHHNLGSFLSRKGELSEAATLLEQALAIRRRQFGKDHYDIAVTLDALALVRVKQGDPVAAAPMMRESLAIYRRLLVADDPYLAAVATQLGRMELATGNVDAALALLDEAVTRRRQAGNQALLADSLSGLAEVELARGATARAETLAREAVALRRDSSGATAAAERAYGNSVLGACLLAGGQLAAAEGLLVPSYRSLRDTLGPTDRRTAVALERVIELYQKLGRVDDVARYQRQRGR